MMVLSHLPRINPNYACCPILNSNGVSLSLKSVLVWMIILPPSFPWTISPSLWTHTHQGIRSFECWVCSSASFLLLWTFLLFINFTVTNTSSLFVDRVFTKSHMRFPLHAFGRAFCGGDSPQKRWNASISASVFKVTGLRSQLSNLKTEGSATWALRFCNWLFPALTAAGWTAAEEAQSRCAPAGKGLLHWTGFGLWNASVGEVWLESQWYH